MAMRQDALAAAAEMIIAVEAAATRHPGVVATVGQIEVPGGAVNTVPGEARFTLDMRSADDALREVVWAEVEREVARIAEARNVKVEIGSGYIAPAAACDEDFCDALAAAMRDTVQEPLRLVSGAGHDAMSFRGVMPFAMLFVRCRDGLSHHPDEHAEPADMGAATQTLLRAIRLLAARH
jgi:allantoate deiminase